MEESDWDGAIFAAAGLERINLRPDNSIELDWMLPAPAQGAIIAVCREGDNFCHDACAQLHDAGTSLCANIERDFLRALLGGCSTPISALAVIKYGYVQFNGNILSKDGRQKKEVAITILVSEAARLGKTAAKELLRDGGQEILNSIHDEN